MFPKAEEWYNVTDIATKIKEMTGYEFDENRIRATIRSLKDKLIVQKDPRDKRAIQVHASCFIRVAEDLFNQEPATA